VTENVVSKDTIDATSKIDAKYQETEPCENKLCRLIVNCPNLSCFKLFPNLNKDSLYIGVEESEEGKVQFCNGVLTVRLYTEIPKSERDSTDPDTETMGWVELDVNNNTLNDVSSDPDNPIHLHYDKKLYDEVISCYGIKSNRELMQTGNDSIYDEDDPTKLPFDQLAYNKAYEKFLNGETDDDDDLPAPLTYDYKDNAVLKRIYSNKYHDNSVDDYRVVLNPRGISIFILYPNPQRIITYKNNHIIDRLKLPYNKADPQGNEITFTISKDYIITVYRNKFTKKGKMIEHKPSAKYKINEDGKFVKID
jgi:hypothetical protein